LICAVNRTQYAAPLGVKGSQVQILSSQPYCTGLLIVRPSFDREMERSKHGLDRGYLVPSGQGVMFLTGWSRVSMS
jgi:hypothetical protein